MSFAGYDQGNGWYDLPTNHQYEKRILSNIVDKLPSEVRQPHVQGMIEIKSVPEDAQIEIDGTWIGNSPRSLPLHVGEYTVRIKKRGYKEWVQRISIAAGDSLSVAADLERGEEDPQP
jgi:hypothetical protein